MGFNSSTSRSTAPGEYGIARRAYLLSSPIVWPAAGLAALAVGYLLTPSDAEARAALGHLALAAGPLAAALACAAASRTAPRLVRGTWLLFGAGAIIVMLGQLLAAFPAAAAMLGFAPPGASELFLLFHLCFTLGAILALRPTRAKGLALEIALDGSLILVAAAVVVERFALPALLAGAELGRAELLGLILSQLAPVGSLFLAVLLVLRGDHLLAARATPYLTAAVAVFLLGNVFLVAGLDPSPARPGDPFDFVWLAGWAALAAAGVAGAGIGRESTRDGISDAARRRIRRAVVPGAAVFLGAVGVDAALNPSASPTIAIACGLMGLLLAARIRHAIDAAERRSEDQRLLAQNRALVEVSHALAGATELSQTLDLVARWASRLLDAYASGIELLDPDGDVLELRAIHGLPSDMLGLRFPVEGSFTGWVVRNGKARAALRLSAEPFTRFESVASIAGFPTAAAPLQVRDRRLGALFAIRLDRPFEPADLELLGALAEQAAVAIQNARLFEQVRQLSMTDPLTGLANRRQLERDLAREFAAARRGRRLFAVLFDLDGFKEYNDRHGHLAGDEALRIFGKVLAAETRAMNLAVRYGGDEFIVLLTESSPEGARIFAERVSEKFSREVASLGRGEITVSAGIAGYDPSMQRMDELIAAADRNLYERKAARSDRSST